MFEAVKHYWSQCSDGVFCAAVADYRPIETSISKIKKTDDELTISFVKNPDIVAWAGSTKLPGQLLVGFALETNDAMRYAKRKMESKKLDFIVLNSLGLKGVGFGVDSNQITIIDSDHSEHFFSLKSKILVADDIITHLFEFS
jgi:phosphopantothenoylcysteine decarboxylase/phosphopantothenate--cysteine ligase